MYFLLLSSVLNIGLDFFTILVLHMSVGGPALATVVSQGISAVLCLAYMIHKFPVLRMEGDEKKPDRDMIRVLCAMGIPMGLQYSITAIGSVILQLPSIPWLHGCGCRIHRQQDQHVFLYAL